MNLPRWAWSVWDGWQKRRREALEVRDLLAIVGQERDRQRRLQEVRARDGGLYDAILQRFIPYEERNP